MFPFAIATLKSIIEKSDL